MLHHRLNIAIAFGFILAIGRSSDHADGQQRSASPLVDPQAIAVAQLDLAKIDPDTLEKTLEAQLVAAKPHPFAYHVWQRSARNLAERLRRLKKLQVTEVYVVLTLHGLEAQFDRLGREPEQFIYAVVPASDRANSEAVGKVLVEDPPGTGQTRDSKSPAGTPLISQAPTTVVESPWLALRFDHATHIDDAAAGTLVLAGSQGLLEHLVKGQREARPSITAALAGAGEGPFQFVVAPAPVFPRAAREILGTVTIDALSVGDALAEGFRWAAIGVSEHSGSPMARVVIQSQSAAGAKQMKQLIQFCLDATEKHPRAKDWRLGELAVLIDFEVLGDQLHWRINKDYTALLEAVRPVLLAQQIRLGVHQSIDQMKQIMVAFHNTYDVYKAFPTPANYDGRGRPLLSWRVNILQYVGENELFREFRRDEPWDSPHNKKLISRMPDVYRRPFAPDSTVTTPYQVPIGDKAVFQPGKKSTFADLRDGSAKTIGLVEVDPQHEVIWTKPDDWEVDWEEPTKGLTEGPGKSFVAGLLDSSVRTFSKSIDKDTLRALLTGAGGEPVGDLSQLPR